MNALQLYRFIQDTGTEWNWINEDTDEPDVFILLEFENIRDFVKMVGAWAFQDDGLDCIIKKDYMVIMIGDICDGCGFSITEVFDKKGEKP